jgi:hypothetical protein
MKKIILIILATLLFISTSSKLLAQETSTDESDIRQKVIEKVQVAKNKPKAYLGTITDKTDDSMQIKNTGGEILLLSVNADEASFIKSNDESTAIKYTDLAIGDFVVAMGLLDDQSVLDAKRILVTTPPTTMTRKIVYGDIVTIGTAEVEIKDKDGTSWTLSFPKRWKGPDLDELSEGEKLIAVGETTGNTIDIRSIFTVDSPTPEN